MSIELKIKSKHLSEEAKIIRFEERKLLKQYQWSLNEYHKTGNNDMYPRWNDKAFLSFCSLHNHRKWDVRNENRATYLARAYIAGIPYKTVEQKRNPDNEHTFKTFVLPRVFAMVVKYNLRILDRTDWEWDKVKQKYNATKQLKDKIVAWCELNQ